MATKIKYTPLPNISASVNYEPNWLISVGEQRLDKKIEIISAELDLALNSKLGITSFYQYSSEEQSSFTSIRFSWEYSPLSYLFILYNIGKSNGISEINLNRSQLLIKLSYQFQL